MRLVFLMLLMATILITCRRQKHCENATVYKSQLCGVDWEVEFEGKRHPVKLTDEMKHDRNRIFIESYHFFADPRLCGCCGYTYVVIDSAVDEAVCL